MAALRFLTVPPPNIHMLLSYFFFFFFFFFFISWAAKSFASQHDSHYNNCRVPFVCGRPSTGIINVTYPFWGNSRPSYCGVREGFKLVCRDNEMAFLDFEDQRYRVLEINQTNQMMTLAWDDLPSTLCLKDSFPNTTVYDSTLFDHPMCVKNLTVLNCSNPHCRSSEICNGIPCHPKGCPHRIALLIEDDVPGGEHAHHLKLKDCSMSVKVPVLQSTIDDLKQGKIDCEDVFNCEDVFDRGFKLQYRVNSSCSGCESSGGTCGTNSSSPFNFVCYCPDKAYSSRCPNPGKSSTLLKVGIGGGMALILVALFLSYRYHNRRKLGRHSSLVSGRNPPAISSSADSEKGGLYHGLLVFGYGELRDATNNFDPQRILGDGGFGTVFYGKLRDGRAVAVKRLYENNCKKVEQFMNEVEILAQLHHPNLVRLYGFTSRLSDRLLLVYEYVPNGTVADHLHGNLAKPGALPWSTRLNIAIQTASALVYLHASDIVHRDVKTNNILLDENFSVKVADFGLSRLFPLNVTHASTAPQGTQGYVDPEYLQCYQLTRRSDVYSFGVVLMELISSLPAADITRSRNEIYLSTMAINKIHGNKLHQLVDPHLGFNSNCNTRKMVTDVAGLGFQCLQPKEIRPSMAKVLSILTDIQKQHRDGEGKKAAESDEAVLLKANR